MLQAIINNYHNHSDKRQNFIFKKPQKQLKTLAVIEQ